MEDKTKNPLPDIVGMILAPLDRAIGGTRNVNPQMRVGSVGADGVRPTSDSKQQKKPQLDVLMVSLFWYPEMSLDFAMTEPDYGFSAYPHTVLAPMNRWSNLSSPVGTGNYSYDTDFTFSDPCEIPFDDSCEFLQIMPMGAQRVEVDVPIYDPVQDPAYYQYPDIW